MAKSRRTPPGEHRGKATRLRQLSAAQEQRLDVLRRVSTLLDSSIVVPGTTYRVGLDPIIGLVPAIGDLVSPLFTIGILWQARELGIPRIVELRMIFNVAIDTLVGMVPIAGDFFDFAWKANDKNMALLERHAYEERRATGSDWIFVVALTLVLLALAAAPFLLAGYVIAVLREMF